MSKSLCIILYVAASLVGLAVVVVGLFVISRLAHSGDVLSGIAVGSADLSGLNDTEARDALLTLEQDMASVPLMVRVQDTVFELDPSTIQLSAGVYPGLIAALRTFSRPGSNVVLLSPNYSGFYYMARHTYTIADESEMHRRDGRYEIDWDDLAARLADPQTQSMIVCNPQNPTGNVWTEEELLKLGQMCLENDVVVLSDEIHSDFVRPGYEYVPFARLPDKDIVDNSLSFNSASKTFNMAGMKNAYWHSTNPTLLERVQHYHFSSVSTLGCVANEAAYREGREWLDQLLVYINDNHSFAESYIAKNMPSVGYNRPEGTYLTWLDFSETMDAIGAVDKAAEHEMATPEHYMQDWLVMNSGVYLNPGSSFGKGSAGKMRFNVGSSRKIVKAALDAMAEAVNSA